ncbi:MAG: MBL fold metallo-hydrolase [Erysipelotrichaceae bacterium]
MNSWFYLIYIIFFFIFAKYPYLYSFFLFNSIIFYKYKKIKPWALIYCALILIILSLNNLHNQEMIIKNSTNKYCLVTLNGNNYYWYGKCPYEKGDSIRGTYQIDDLVTTKNFTLDSFNGYLFYHDIKGSIKIKDDILLVRNNLLSNKVKQLLYKNVFWYQLIYEKELVNYENIIISSGILFISLLKVINLILKFFLNKKNLKLFNIIYYLIMYMLFDHVSSLLIMFIYQLTHYQNWGYEDLIFYLIIFILGKEYLYNYLTLIMFLNYCISYWGLNKNQFIIKLLLGIVVQIVVFNQINIGYLLLYGLYKYVFILFIFFPDIFNQLFILLNSSFLTSGYIHSIFGIIILMLINLYLNTKRDRNLLWVLNLMIVIIYPNYFNPNATITFLDVKQADCAIISLPFNQGNIMIDAGNNLTNSTYEKIIKPYLVNRRIKYIDGIIVSHIDDDHSKSVPNILRDFKVGVVIDRPINFKIGNLQVFNYQYLDSDNSNDQSIVTYFSLNNINYLFSGDISSLVERQLGLDLPVSNFDVLKVAHHGSKHSTSVRFLDRFSFNLAFISCGKINSYGHPSDIVVNNLQNSQVEIVNSSIDGSLLITSNKFLTYYQTKGNKFGIIK